MKLNLSRHKKASHVCARLFVCLDESNLGLPGLFDDGQQVALLDDIALGCNQAQDRA